MSTEAAILDRRASTYRDYPEELKAAIVTAIQNNGGNVNATAKLFNIPRDTVNYWWQNSARFTEIQQASSLNLADKLESVAHSYVDSLATHDQSIVTAKDKATIANLAIANMQLLRGQPTTITEQVERTDVTIILQSALADAIDVSPLSDEEPTR